MTMVIGWALIGIAAVCLLVSGIIVHHYSKTIDRASRTPVGGPSFASRQAAVGDAIRRDPIVNKLLWVVTLCGFGGAHCLDILDMRTLFPPVKTTYSAINPPSEANPGDTWTNPLDGSVLVFVGAGEFSMGSEEGSFDQQPTRRVFVDGYWFGKYPVTNQQFRKFVDATGYKTDAERTTWARANWRQHTMGRDEHAVIGVSWHDARAYCRWAGLRLPTEAEWERAAKGTDERAYPWGNEWSARKCTSLESQASISLQVGTVPVNQFDRAGSASPCGAMCMAGNVWEYCYDFFGPYKSPPGAAAPARNPTGPPQAVDIMAVNDVLVGNRVLRGGSWRESKQSLRTTARLSGPASYADDDRGFRVAFGEGPVFSRDILNEILDLSDRVALRGYQAPVVALRNGREIVAGPSWLHSAIDAESHILTGQSRKALSALDRAEQEERSSLVSYLRGDIYTSLALLNLLERGRYALQPQSVTCALFPDEEVIPLLEMAENAYRDAEVKSGHFQEFELRCGVVSVPRVSRQYARQVKASLEGSSDEFLLETEGLAAVAAWISQLFVEDSAIIKVFKFAGDSPEE